MTPFPRSRHRAAPAVLGGVLVAALAGCGADDSPGSAGPGGDASAAVPVSNTVKLLNIRLAYPEDGVWTPGEDPRLYFSISNIGTEDDTLTGITGPDFASADDGDGAPGVDITVAAKQLVNLSKSGPPTVTLTDLDRELRTSQSIPITFTFAKAGSATADVTVAAKSASPTSESQG